VHAGAGLGDDAGLLHAAREQRLPDGVVHLVRAGVVQVLALEVDLRAAAALGKALGVIDRTGSPNVVLELVAKLGLELRVLARLRIGDAQRLERGCERLRDERAAVRAEMPARIGQVIDPHF
jgi:hypothetical protein